MLVRCLKLPRQFLKKNQTESHSIFVQEYQKKHQSHVASLEQQPQVERNSLYNASFFEFLWPIRFENSYYTQRCSLGIQCIYYAMANVEEVR